MDLFFENQKLSLNFVKNGAMVEMFCTIEKIFDDRLHVILPKYFMRYIDCLQVGMKLTAKVFSKCGTIDFNTVIISSPLEDDFSIELDYNTLRLEPEEDLEPIEAIEKVLITNMDETYDLSTLSLAADYFIFESKELFNINDALKCTLILPEEYGTIKFEAIVTERDEIYDTEYTAKYTIMTEPNRQALLYYMYRYASMEVMD